MQSSATQTTQQVKSYPYAPDSLDPVGTSGKSLGVTPPSGTSGKKLAGADEALNEWYQNALPYWQAVQNGQIQVSPEQYQQLQDWMQWAQSELESQGSLWGGIGGSDPTSLSGEGTSQNSIFADDHNELTCDGSVSISDVWGSRAILNVPPPCTVSFENTVDTRFNPPEAVIKAVVKNPAKRDASGQAAESVVYFHDGVQITCNASKKSDGTSRVQDWTGNVTVGNYHASSTGEDGESSIAGVEKDGKLIYEPEYDGETVSFKSVLGEDGQTTTRVVWADANITVKPSDQVDVSKDASTGIVTVTVTHSNGSKDVYEVQKGYEVNINAHAVTYGGAETMPSELQGLVTINGGIDENGESTSTSGDIVDALLEATGCSETQLMNALDSAGYQYDNIEAFKAAIANHEFPGGIDESLLNFLSALDPDLHEIVSSLAATDDSAEKTSLYEDGTKRIEELLSKLCPDSIVRTEVVEYNGSQWGEFSIDGKKYAWNYHESDPDDFYVSPQ